MSVDFRFPNITATDEAGQLLQVKSYLHQLVGQLNYAMKAVGNVSTTSVSYENKTTNSVSSEESNSQATFNSIKGLIIKSADIVNAYYESISARLNGLYVAESDFGVYKEETEARFNATSKDITQNYTDTQTILDKLSDDLDRIDTTAYIKSGLLYYDNETEMPVYGLAIGQKTDKDGEEIFDQYATFTTDKLTFYDSNGVDVAYISDKKLYITNVEITGSFLMGGFKDKVLPDGRGVVTKWEGTGG
jgi:hypothetical protein